MLLFVFCFQNICAVGALRGANPQIKHMLDPERLYVSAGSSETILFTLWAALIKHSYFLTVMAGIAQALALLYYQLVSSRWARKVSGSSVNLLLDCRKTRCVFVSAWFVGMVLPTGGSVGHARRRSASLLPT